MLFPQSICVCMPCFNSAASWVCIAKEQILALFGPDMNIEMGVVMYMYLKISQNNFILNIYMGSWSNSLGSSVFTSIPFGHF